MNAYKFDEIYVGLTHSFKSSISPSAMDKFLEISNDTNPLHIDQEYAVEKGFDGKVVYGLLTSTFYSTLVGVHLPGKYCILQGINIQYSKPVYVGDQLTISGKVHYINEAYKQIEIKAMITNQYDEKVSIAMIKAGVMDE